MKLTKLALALGFALGTASAAQAASIYIDDVEDSGANSLALYVDGNLITESNQQTYGIRNLETHVSSLNPGDPLIEKMTFTFTSASAWGANTNKYTRMFDPTDIVPITNPNGLSDIFFISGATGSQDATVTFYSIEGIGLVGDLKSLGTYWDLVTGDNYNFSFNTDPYSASAWDPTGERSLVFQTASDTYGVASAPEPASLALLGLGMVGLAACRRKAV